MLWRTTQTPTCAKRKRNDDDHDEQLNSSFQVPSYARITNARVKAGEKLHLLTLPSYIRLYIYRIAIIESTPILVSASNKIASKPPGLLEVSHDVREEAIKIFYAENDFDLLVHDFDAAALLPWLNKTDGHRAVETTEIKREGGLKQQHSGHALQVSNNLFGTFNPEKLSPTQTWMLEKQRIYHPTSTTLHLARSGTLGWTILFEPDWHNLVKWLELYHADKLPRPQTESANRETESAAFASFQVVRGLRGEKWELVKKALPGIQEILGAAEPKWLESGNGED